MVYGQDFCKKKRRKQDCFCEKTAPQAKFIKKNVQQAIFFGLNPSTLFS